MQTRANTKAVNHWFLMLFIVLIFLYFIGYVLGLGTSKTAKKLNKLLAVFFFYAAKSKNCTKKMEK
mgnify:CR=1 FL=1